MSPALKIYLQYTNKYLNRKNYKTEKQYGNHYEQISMHLRMLQAELPQEAFYMNQRTRTTTTTAKNVVCKNARRHRNQDKVCI